MSAICNADGSGTLSARALIRRKIKYVCVCVCVCVCVSVSDANDWLCIVTVCHTKKYGHFSSVSNTVVSAVADTVERLG